MRPVELARDGLNTRCVDCRETPFGGGLRCLPCFQARAEANRRRAEHLCVRHLPGPSCYQLCRCRCEQCRDGKRAYSKMGAK